MVKDAEANAEADKKKKELIEAKNQAESLIHTTEKTLKENADKVSSADKEAIESAITALKGVIEGDDAAAIKEKSDALMQASLKLGEAMYKAQGAAAGAGNAQGAEQGAPEAEPKKTTTLLTPILKKLNKQTSTSKAAGTKPAAFLFPLLRCLDNGFITVVRPPAA